MSVIHLNGREPKEPEPQPEPEPWLGDAHASAAAVSAMLASGQPDGEAIWRAGIAAGLGGDTARQLYLTDTEPGS